jgi:hypothetical protein
MQDHAGRLDGWVRPVPRGTNAPRSRVRAPAMPADAIVRTGLAPTFKRCGQTRLLTLLGPGGVGKTRLGLTMAEFTGAHVQAGRLFRRSRAAERCATGPSDHCPCSAIARVDRPERPPVVVAYSAERCARSSRLAGSRSLVRRSADDAPRTRRRLHAGRGSVPGRSGQRRERAWTGAASGAIARSGFGCPRCGRCDPLANRSHGPGAGGSGGQRGLRGCVFPGDVGCRPRPAAGIRRGIRLTARERFELKTF